jgi:hypothetical protein
MDINSTEYRRKQVAAILGVRLRRAREPVDRRMLASALDAVTRGADPDLVEAARRRAWAAHLDELDEPGRIVERLEAELVGLTTKGAPLMNG